MATTNLSSNRKRGAKHMVEGEIGETIAARVKVWLTTAEWDKIKAAVNNGAIIPTEASREVLMGYHYALLVKDNACYRKEAKF
jgi:hypothetical protein